MRSYALTACQGSSIVKQWVYHHKHVSCKTIDTLAYTIAFWCWNNGSVTAYNRCLSDLIGPIYYLRMQKQSGNSEHTDTKEISLSLSSTFPSPISPHIINHQPTKLYAATWSSSPLIMTSGWRDNRKLLWNASQCFCSKATLLSSVNNKSLCFAMITSIYLWL